MNKIIVYIFASLLFVGCGSEAVKPAQKAETVKKGFDENGKPLWISNADYDGNIGVISIIPKNKIKNRKKMLYIAEMQARAEFESNKGTTVSSSATTATDAKGKVTYSEDLEMSSKHIQTDKLVVKATYEDESSFYMWMVVEK